MADLTKKKFSLGKIWREYSYIFVMVIIILVYAITVASNGVTFKFSHIASILGSQNTCIVGTMALGMALVVITGNIDLSLGSGLVLCTGCSILVFNLTGSAILMFLAAIAAGALCGLVNGVLIGLAKMQAFIATLGTMLIYRSLTLSVVRAIPQEISGSNSSQFAMIAGTPTYEALRKFGTGKIANAIPWITILFIVLSVVIIIISKKTKFGKSVYAIGSNANAARLAGINVTGVKIMVFVITGILVGFASFIQACKIGNITPASSGQSYEMYAVAAIVLGGISMSGGKGNLVGIIFGAISYSAINFIIVSIPALSVDIQNAFQGLVLIVVILVQTLGPIFKEKIQTAKKRKAALAAEN
ncbi:MAG: ABC transporter permease [Bacillota bacterium]|nr:ABC transporter permease [Bacillota bacterium]